MIRFFATPDDVSTNSIKLSAKDSEHIRALRLRPDELFIVCNGEGIDYECRLGEAGDGSVAMILNQHHSIGEPSIICKVFIAYSKGERLDYAISKSVELGAHSIILFESDRCVSIPKDIPKKVARLQRIAEETAKQCGRGIIPEVTSGGSLDDILSNDIWNSELSLMFYEVEDNLHIKHVLEKHFPPLRESEEYGTSSISLITGPEGGFDPDEMSLAVTKSVKIVSLGPRILRSETAPVVALAAVMYHTGNL